MFNFKTLVLFLFILTAGCSNKYDACINKQQTDYRANNPNASYAEAQRKYAEFEMMCSSLKGK